jgi:DNA-binding NarL/FixJ family response regulator
MNRLFVIADDAAVEHATRFARRCPAGLNLFALTDRDGSIRDAVREARPDMAILVGVDDAEQATRHAHEVSDEAPSAVVLVLGAPSDDDVADEVCHATAIACLAVASKQRDLDSLPGEPTGTPTDARPNGNEAGPASACATCDEATAQDIAEEEETGWPLTPREIDVLRAAAEGYSNAEIGRQLWVTEQTVKFHLSNIYRKLSVSNRTEAMRRAVARGLVSAPGSVSDSRSARTPVMVR